MRFFILIFSFTAALFGQDGMKAAALFTALDGEVTVLRPPATGPAPAQILGELFPGDSLKTGADGSATILYQDGKIVTIGNNSRAAISPSDSVRGGRSGEEGDNAHDPGRLVALIAESEKIAANLAVRGEEDSLALVVYEPGNTALLTGKPRFVWSLFPGAQSYRIKIQRMGSDIWSVITVDTLLPYPENKPELAAGTYLVRIAALTIENDTLGMTDRTIRILTPEDTDTVQYSIRLLREQRPDTFTFHLLAAKIYETQKLRVDAIREYESLLRIKPDLPFVHRSLSILYKENGQTRPANYHYDRWEELISSGK